MSPGRWTKFLWHFSTLSSHISSLNFVPQENITSFEKFKTYYTFLRFNAKIWCQKQSGVLYWMFCQHFVFPANVSTNMYECLIVGAIIVCHCLCNAGIMECRRWGQGRCLGPEWRVWRMGGASWPLVTSPGICSSAPANVCVPSCPVTAEGNLVYRMTILNSWCTHPTRPVMMVNLDTWSRW